MLYDRDYMRDRGGPDFRSPVVLLLIGLLALFFVECVLRVYGQGSSLANAFALSRSGMAQHQYYRLLTFQFLHEAPWPWHILMNGIGLWFFGRSVLETLGARRFWILYVVAGTAAGMLDWLCQVGHPRYEIGLGTIGASGNIMGLAAAFCLMHPGQDIVFFLYVFPVKLRAMTMFWLLFGFSVFGVVFPFGGVSHAAHLGGLLAGVAFVKVLSREGIPGWWSAFRGRGSNRRPELTVAAGHHGSGVAPSAGGEVEPANPDEYMRREVDPILDKILAHGPQSLTEKERRILEQAPKRLRKP